MCSLIFSYYKKQIDPSLILPDTKPDLSSFTTTTTNENNNDERRTDDDEEMMQKLHTLLLETQVMQGSLICGKCGHEYAIREGVANFLLPSHLGTFPFFFFVLLSLSVL